MRTLNAAGPAPERTGNRPHELSSLGGFDNSADSPTPAATQLDLFTRSQERRDAEFAEKPPKRRHKKTIGRGKPKPTAEGSGEPGTVAASQAEQQISNRGNARPDNKPFVISATDLRSKKFPPLRFIVDGFIAEGCTLLAGKPKLGKSWLMLDIALATARGQYCLGNAKCDQGAVLYLADHLARAIGQFGWSSFNTKRRDLRNRLKLLRDSFETAADILASVGDLREKIDVDLLGFIANVAVEAEPGLTSSAMNRKYAAAHEQIRHMLKDVKAAETIIEQSSADGPARATYYDLIVEGARSAAQSLAIPLTIGGDRDGNPHDTPFVRLVMGLESLLPSEMQSPSLAACAKRIERSPAWCLTR